MTTHPFRDGAGGGEGWIKKYFISLLVVSARLRTVTATTAPPLVEISTMWTKKKGEQTFRTRSSVSGMHCLAFEMLVSTARTGKKNNPVRRSPPSSQKSESTRHFVVPGTGYIVLAKRKAIAGAGGGGGTLSLLSAVFSGQGTPRVGEALILFDFLKLR